MRDSYELRAKQRSRVLLRKFIKRHIEDPPLASVLCLPGPEALEIFEVYDKVGILRENIVCLERDPDHAEALRKLDLGCEIVELSVEEFFILNMCEGAPGPKLLDKAIRWPKSKRRKFDIISLDITGQLAAIQSALFLLYSSFSTPGVLFTNICGARETERTKSAYRLLTASKYAKDTIGAVEREIEQREWAISKYVSQTIVVCPLRDPSLFVPFVKDWIGFKYVNGSTPMLGDMFSVGLTTDKQKASKSHYFGKTGSRIFLRHESELAPKYISLEARRAHALRLVEKGWSLHDAAKQTGVTRPTVAAWKAHVTMGTYTK